MAAKDKDQPPRLRLSPALQPRDLPSHPQLAVLQTNSETPALLPFVRAILDEATTFADEQVSHTFTDRGAKPAPPSSANVRVLSSDRIPGEAWFARRSLHIPGTSPGTATYAEFESGLFDDHTAKEMEYTPTIYDAVEVLNWNAELAAASSSQNGEADGPRLPYSDVHMSIHEVAHRIPAPLNNRVFAVLLVRGKPRSFAAPTTTDTAQDAADAGGAGNPGFVTAQIPVDASGIKEALYSNGRHRAEGDSAEKRGKVVIGAYVSVERVRVLPGTVDGKAAAGAGNVSESQAGQKGGEEAGAVDWLMATASDARGNLPMAVQKRAMPGTVVKDVGYFMDWMIKKRKGAA